MDLAHFGKELFTCVIEPINCAPVPMGKDYEAQDGALNAFSLCTIVAHAADIVGLVTKWPKMAEIPL